MDWKDWIGKRVFIRTKSKKVFSGKVISTDDMFLEIIDKFNSKVTLAIGEVLEIKEEGQ